MFNKTLGWFTAFILISSTSFAAQTTLNFQAPNQAAPSNAPIPPNEFANQVKATNEQNHAKFTQELTQQKNALANPKIPSLSEVQSMSQTPPPNFAEPEQSQPTETTGKNKPATNTAPAPTEPMNVIAPEQPATNSPPPTTNTAPPPRPASPPSQPYTGFGAPSSPSSGSQQPKSGSGFNIQY